ncbi:MAG: heavy metal translocating P-type ATPase, partial [bacterium]
MSQSSETTAIDQNDGEHGRSGSGEACDHEARDEHNHDDGMHDHDHGSFENASFWTQKETIVTAIAGLFYFVGLIWELLLPGSLNSRLVSLGGIELYTADLILLTALVIGGLYTFRRGFRALLSFTMSIDFLITLALLGALVLGKFLEAASLAFLYGVAELLEDYSMQQAQSSLEELLDLSPNEATLLKNGERETVEVEDIDVGETIAVRPGEKIAMDGQVVDGTSSVNEAPVTGESMPVEKQPGDDVYAGTFNEDGYLEIEVTRRVEDNTLAKIIEMVKEAEASKAPSQRFVDTFAGYYTPAVVSLALVVGLVVPFLPGVDGGFVTWWLRAMALLVIACPCGLLISTPVTVVSGITSAAGHGTLIKGGEPFEGLGQLDVICFDKTGTLSEGEPSVSDVVPLNSFSEDELLSIAAAVESRSEHHLAEAITNEARERELEIQDVSEFEAITAAGVKGDINGTQYYVGKPELLDREPPESFMNLEEEGKTVVCVGTDEELMGIIAISDQIRPEAKEVISDLHDIGIEVVMITGDNERTAQSVAGELSIDHYHAELLPEDKVNEIERLRQDYGSIAMVGDGINDAPALARAN